MTYNIGDTAYASFGRYGRIDARCGKVVNVSPTGVIKIDFNGTPYSFQPNGWQRGVAVYERAQLISAEQFTALYERQRKQRLAFKANEAIKLITAISLDGDNTDTVITRLERALELARKVKN